MMFYNNAVMSKLGQRYWECWRVGGTHTRDTGGKDRNSIALYLLQVPGFCSQKCGQLKCVKWNLNGAIRCTV